MIKIGICDDELSIAKLMAKEMINLFVTLNIDADICVITDNQKVLIDAIKENKIDALYLDIDFKGKGQNGIEFAKRLRKFNNEFFLTFTTTHPECTFHCFDCKTFDYILKPVTTEKLIKNLKRLKSEFDENPTFIININRNIDIRINDILFIERLMNHCIVHTKDEEYTCNMSLKSLLEKLTKSFKQNHRSFIVNIEAIKKIDKQRKTLKFEGNKECPLGKLKLINSKGE